MRRIPTIALAALAALAFAVPAATAAERLAQEARPFTADAYRDAVAWSSWDESAQRYRLKVTRDGRPIAHDVPLREVPFDVDLGPLGTGDGIGAVYSRCLTEERGCDIFVLDLQTGEERRATGLNTASSNETRPSLYRDTISFVRSLPGGRSMVYVRREDESRSRRQPVPRGEGTAIATELGSATRLAYTWASRRNGFGTQYLYRVKGDGHLERIARAASGGANSARILAPSWAGMLVYFARTNVGSGSGNRIYRYAIGTRALAAAPGSSGYTSVTYAGSGRFIVAESIAGQTCTDNILDPPERSVCFLERTDPLVFTPTRRVL